MGTLSIWHWVIVLVIVMLVFGTKKLRNVGEDLGGAVRGFKEGMKAAEHETPGSATPPAQLKNEHAQGDASVHKEARKENA